eukprot:scaffold48940_cov38-Attheya_sp.AAC.1
MKSASTIYLWTIYFLVTRLNEVNSLAFGKSLLRTHKKCVSQYDPVVRHVGGYSWGLQRSVGLAATSSNDDVDRMRKEAERLRQEVDAFQKAKDDAARAVQDEKERIQAKKRDARLRYSAEVPILKGDGSTVMERCDFPPRLPKGKSIIDSFEAPLPLGIILGEHEEISGAVRVDEVVEGGNGELVGIQEGDLLRACTACQMTMETPTWQLIAGGIGQPKTKRFMYSVDRRPFEEVMEAVSSNRMDPEERPVVLVIERTT